MINEPSVFEPLNFYCIESCSLFSVVTDAYSEDLFSDDDDFLDDGLTEPEILAMLDEVECKSYIHFSFVYAV